MVVEPSDQSVIVEQSVDALGKEQVGKSYLVDNESSVECEQSEAEKSCYCSPCNPESNNRLMSVFQGEREACVTTGT